jgi:hypothetical protein
VLFLLAVLGAIFVFTAFAAGGRSVRLPVAPEGSDQPAESRNGPQVGDCIDIGRAVVVVSCGGPHDGEVDDIRGPLDDCPPGTAYVPIGPKSVACVRPTG